MYKFSKPKSLQQYDKGSNDGTIVVPSIDSSESSAISPFFSSSKMKPSPSFYRRSSSRKSKSDPQQLEISASSSFTQPDSNSGNSNSNPTKRQIISFYLNSSSLGRRWDQLDAFFNFLMCSLFIYFTTYITKANDIVPYRLLVLDSTLSFLLFLLFLPRFYVSPDARKFLFSSFSILSFLTILTPFLILLNIYLDPSIYYDTLMSSGIWVFIYPVRFVRLYYSLVKVLSSVKNTLLNDPATNQALESIIVVFSTVLSITALTHIVLCLQNYTADGQPVDFFDVLFFTAVSSVTGLKSDVAPDSTFTRLVSISILFLGIFWLPQRMSSVLSLIKDRNPWSSSYSPEPNQKHVIIIGDIWFGSLFEFLREFYCEDHGPQIVNTNVVLMSENPPSKKIQSLLKNPVYSSSVSFVLGSPTSYNDLEAINAHSASSVFVLSDKNSNSRSFEEDSKKIMICLAIRRFLISKNVSTPIYAQALLPETSLHLDYITKDIICIPELRLGLLAIGINVPGFSSLLQGLFTSIPDDTTDQLIKAVKSSNYSPYLEEYIFGLGQEIYPTKFSPFFKGMKFSIVAHYIYKNFNSILFALKINPDFVSGESDIPVSGPNDIVYLNPTGYILTGDEIGFIISTDSFVPNSILSVKKSSLSSLNNDSDESQPFLSEPQDSLSSVIFKSKLASNTMDSVIIDKSSNSKKVPTPNPIIVSSSEDNPDNHPLDQGNKLSTDENEAFGTSPILQLLEPDQPKDFTHEDSLPQSSGIFNAEAIETNSEEEINPSSPTVDENSQTKISILLPSDSSTSILKKSQSPIPISENSKETPFPKVSETKEIHSSSSNLVSATIKRVDSDYSSGSATKSAPLYYNHVVICCTGTSFPPNMEYLVGSIRTSIYGSQVYLKELEKSNSLNNNNPLSTKNELSTDKTSFFYNFYGKKVSEFNTADEKINQSPSFPNMQPVVFLCPCEPDSETKTILEGYGSVFFVNGTPLSKHGLIKANISSSSKAIVLISNYSSSYSSGASLSQKTDINVASSDSLTLLAVLNIEYLTANNKDFSMFIEFNYRENMKFIGSSSELVISEEYIQSFFRPCFMSGNCSAPVMLDTLICQTFYNKDLISIVKNMIFPNGDITHDVEYSKMVSAGLPISEIPKNIKGGGSKLDSNVFMMPVPEDFYGKTYSALFSYFIFKHNGICLGLYRNSLAVVKGYSSSSSSSAGNVNEHSIETQSTGQVVNFFVANPKQTTVLNSSDKVYILCTTLPNSL
ncbi:Calcium-activated potassium channel slowpoke [Smittium mucronatum]|uniref:Calcium-activated potassium channel slowpoke n=1 Tax=Smittium mucronatum TaxID=133383 RepID=A0A1R0GLM1_9FUNG|nr:Calcium-activated potassium channel slowpoke [Smittium mucronatum]